MAICVRSGRPTDPVNARLQGHHWRRHSGIASSSSGSEHEVRLSMRPIHDFLLEDDAASASPDADDDPTVVSDDDKTNPDPGRGCWSAKKAIRELLRLCEHDADPFRLRLLADAADAAKAAEASSVSASGHRRSVMARLRERGYDAGVCKAKWEGSGKIVAGSYEYIDAVAAPEHCKGGSEGERRYIIDVAFAAEFEVARASDEYQQVVTTLPELMVARPEAVRETVRIVAAAARRSLKARGMHVPPWRKEKYMVAKWLGAYRRTTNVVPACSGIAIAGAVDNVGVVRAVGFATMTDVMNLPQAARIR